MVRLLLRLRRPRSLVAALLAAALASSVPAGAAMAAPPPYTLEERAAAIASPALVFLDIEFEGYVRRRDTGAVVDEDPVSIRIRCSGMVVTSDGYVVTTRFCLENSPARLRESAIGVVADRRIRANLLAQDQRTAFLADLRANTDYTGPAEGAPPEVTVAAQMYFATNDLGQANVISAQAVRTSPEEDAVAALVKLDATGLPVANLHTEMALNPGTPVVVVGWGAPVPADAIPASYPVVWQPATVVGRVGDELPALYRIDTDLGSGSHGGMVVNNDGQVFGMVSTDGSGSYSLVADSLSIVNLLASAGVTNEQTPGDEAYRQGLDAYFGGHYADAIDAFDTAIAAQPSNMSAISYRDQARGRLALEGESSTFNGVWILLGVAAAGVTLVVMAVLVILRGRRMHALERELEDYEPAAITATAVAGAHGAHAAPTHAGGYPMVALPAAPQPLPPQPLPPQPLPPQPLPPPPMPQPLPPQPMPQPPTGAWPPPPQPLPPQPMPAQPAATAYDGGGWAPPEQPAPAYPGGWTPPEQPATPSYDGGWTPPEQPAAPQAGAAQPVSPTQPPGTDAYPHQPTDWPAEALWRQAGDGTVPPPGPAPNPQQREHS